MERHLGALPTLSQSNEIGFHLNIPISELIKHVIQAIKASDITSTFLVAETADGATVTK